MCSQQNSSARKNDCSKVKEIFFDSRFRCSECPSVVKWWRFMGGEALEIYFLLNKKNFLFIPNCDLEEIKVSNLEYRGVTACKSKISFFQNFLGMKQECILGYVLYNWFSSILRIVLKMFSKYQKSHQNYTIFWTLKTPCRKIWFLVIYIAS